MIKLKRAYEKPSRKDGWRILVERLWPRGLSKADAAIDLWLKDIAPSPQLRKWFAHDSAKWEQFRRRYWKELSGNKDAVTELTKIMKRGAVTFVYAARDPEHNSAVALQEYLKRSELSRR